MFGTHGGTSSPDADQWTVHVMMQIARTWTMCRMAEAAHARWQQKRPSLRTIFSGAVIMGPASQLPPPSQPPLLTASQLSAAGAEAAAATPAAPMPPPVDCPALAAPVQASGAAQVLRLPITTSHYK